MMNILIIAHNLLPPFQDVLLQYVENIPNHVACVHLVILSEDIPTAFNPKRKIMIHTLHQRKLGGLKLKLIWKLFQITKTQSFDWIITHRYKPFYLALCLQFLKPSKKILGIFHEFNCFQSKARQFFLKSMRFLFPKKEIHLGGVSKAIVDDLKKSLLPSNPFHFHVLYNAIEIQNFFYFEKMQAREILRLPKDAFIFGNIARLVPNKNQSTLIKAFAHLKSAMPNAHLVLIGEGRERTRLEIQSGSLGLSSSIHFLGKISSAAQYLKAFDVFVLPSSQEAFGRVLLEAMLARIPILASNQGGIPEILKDIGDCLPAHDDLAFAKAMQTLANQAPQLTELRVNQQYERLQSHFSYPAFARKLAKILS